MLACAGTAEAAPLRWADSPTPIDNLRPGDWRHITSASCPSPSFCVAIDVQGGVFVSRDPGGGVDAWSFTTIPPGRVLVDIDCPTTSFCVAVGELGTIATSTDPAAGAWTVARVGDERLGMVECPTTSLCVTSDFSGNVYTSTAPTGGTAAWTLRRALGSLSTLSCPAVNLCVAATFTGVVTSTDPTDGPSWTYAPIAWNGYAEYVSCGSPSLCVVTSSLGHYATSTNPAGGTAAWSVSEFGPSPYHEIVCATSTLCVASEIGGSTTYVSKNPTGGPATWAGQSLAPMRPLACAGDGFCIATDNSTRGALLTSSDPASGTWARTRFDRYGINALTDVACPAPTRCLAVDEAGRVLASDDPSGPLEAWREDADLSDLGAGGLLAVACPTVTFCVAGDANGALFTREGAWRRSAPGAGSPIGSIACASPAFCVAVDGAGRILRWIGTAWSLARAGDGRPLHGVACPSTALCVAVGESGTTLVSTDGGTTWSAHRVTIDNEPLYAITCPSSDLCVAGGSQGRLLLTLTPTVDWSWRMIDVPAGTVTGVECPSASLCVAVDASGQTFASNDPAGGRWAWFLGPKSPAPLTSVACAADAVCTAVDHDGFAWSATGTGVPFNTSPPTITGDATPGATLRCSPGAWSPAPESLRYQWERFGEEIFGATSETYTAPGFGALHCRVTAVNAAGEATARGALTIARPALVLQPESPLRVPPARPAFSARIAPRAPRLGSLARSGLPVTVTCSARCTIALRLHLDARDSRRLRLKRNSPVGTARARLTASGSITVRVRLTAVARRALSRTRPARLRLRLSATESSKRAVAGARTLTLRR